MKSKLLSGTGLVIVAIIVLAVNLFGILLFRKAKIDMTEERLFTLSQGSVKTIKAIQDGVTAEFLFSKTALANIPMLKVYGERVAEMLREYQGLSHGKIKLEIIDPRPDTETEETAESSGLQGIMPEGATERIYLGLVLKNESGNDEVIRFFDPRREDSLEYDISKAFYKVSHPERKKVGVLSTLDIMGESSIPFAQPEGGSRPWTLIRELKNSFQVSKVDASATEIPKDLDLLLLVHPKNLSEPTQYAIDQYVLNGGKLAVFIDPFCEADQQGKPMNMQMSMETSFSSNIPRLLKNWGVEMQTVQNSGGMMSPTAGGMSPGIVEDPDIATKVNSPGGEPANMITYLNLQPANFNSKEIVSSALRSMILGAAGALKKTGSRSDVQYTSLLTTTEKASLMPDTMLKFGRPNPEMLLREFKPGSAKLDLACKITGKFKTAFPDGKPGAPPAPDSKEPPAGPTKDPRQRMESKQPSTIFVVADVDMISDRFSVRTIPFFGQEMTTTMNDNLNFAYNVIENLTGSEDLIGLRCRGGSQRPFTTVDEIERQAREKWLAQERELNQKLNDANRRLSELQQGDTKERRILDQAYMAEVKKFREERLSTLKQLREVRRHLREDIERLQSRVVFINVVLAPLLVAIAGGFIAIRKNFA
jgi:ABC-type uncharacterized transport system involved in gliding motility auxiliary subunit